MLKDAYVFYCIGGAKIIWRFLKKWGFYCVSCATALYHIMVRNSKITMHLFDFPRFITVRYYKSSLVTWSLVKAGENVSYTV